VKILGFLATPSSQKNDPARAERLERPAIGNGNISFEPELAVFGSRSLSKLFGYTSIGRSSVYMTVTCNSVYVLGKETDCHISEVDD